MMKNADPKNIVLYDADCGLCSTIVRFLAAKDRDQLYYFMPLESVKGREYQLNYLMEDPGKGSLLLIENGRIYSKSDAVFHILKGLKGLWSVLYLLIVVPKFIRDPAYDLVARNRYRWSGSCNENHETGNF